MRIHVELLKLREQRSDPNGLVELEEIGEWVSSTGTTARTVCILL